MEGGAGATIRDGGEIPDKELDKSSSFLGSGHLRTIMTLECGSEKFPYKKYYFRIQ